MRRNEQWKELCRQASIEKDPARLSTLVNQITAYFDGRVDDGKKRPRPSEPDPQNQK